MAEQTAAQKQKVEDKVEAGADRVKDKIEEPVQEASDQVAEAEEQAVEAAVETEKVVEEAVQEEAQKVSDQTGIPKSELIPVFREEVRAWLDRQHAAHGGENPPPVVTAAATGAASGAASEAATKATEKVIDKGSTNDNETPTDDDTKPAPKKRDSPPQSGHWKDRPLFGRRK